MQAGAEQSAGYKQNEVIMVARQVRKFIKYIGAALVALFAYLQLKDFQVGTAIETISPDLMQRLKIKT
jgi:hypothetical protein